KQKISAFWLGKKVKVQFRSTFWLEKQKISAFSSAEKHFPEARNLIPNE
ncbi:hypothetical protein Gotur_001295, partial [Gossypium turneri]